MSTKSPPDIAPHAPQRLSSAHGSRREAVLLSIKQALVTSRLTLTDQDAGADPYDRRQSPNPGLVWTLRGHD